MNFCFIASNNLDLSTFNDTEKFINDYPDFQAIILNSEEELMLLLRLIGIKNIEAYSIKGNVFSKYWNLSDFKLPEYSESEFDSFYHKWLKISGRNNNMDEYGSLVFLQGLSVKWNKLKYRFVIKEFEEK